MSAEMYVRRAIIVTSKVNQADSNIEAKRVDKTGGERTFTRGLVPKSPGKPPITHYWCGWQLTQGEWDALWPEFRQNNGKRNSRMFDGNVWTPEQVLSEMKLAVAPPNAGTPS